MSLDKLKERRIQLQASLKNLEQSFHIVTGHLAEVDYQITELESAKVKEVPEEEPVQVL